MNIKDRHSAIKNIKTIKTAFCTLIAFAFLCGGSGCSQTQSGKEQQSEAHPQKKTFTLPEIPLMLTSPESRAEYLAAHYWDNFDFTDTTLISKPEITEQALVDFLNILPRVSAENSSKALDALMDSAAADSAMFRHFIKLTENYLYDPNSPMRNEDYYIQVLNRIISSSKLDDVYKARPQYQLKKAMKNRPGNMATDFRYTLKDGTVAAMSAIRADYTVLYFNNPDCRDCKRVKEFIKHSETFNRLVAAGAVPALRILAVYPDADISLWKRGDYPGIMINGYDATQTIMEQELYDLKAIPTLYLLDKDKRVILKDVPVEQVEEWLQKALNKG